MKTALVSCIILGGLCGLGGCGTDEPTPSGSAGTGGSTAGGGGGGAPSAGGTTGGAGTGGSSAGSMTMSGAGGTAGGGAGGTAGGGAGGTGGGGAAACDPSTGKALAFKNNAVDNITGDLGADLVGANTARTLELWAHFQGEPSWEGEHTILELGKGNAGNQVFGIDMAGRDGQNGVFDPYTNGVGDNDPTPIMLAAEGWYHLAFGYDGAGHFQFVVNGTKVTIPHPGDGSGTLKTTQGIVTLGGSQGFGAQGWQGEMDEVRIWSTFRSEAEIKANMKVKLKGTETGLVAYYNLDEGTGTTADDIAKKASHKLAFCAASGAACSDANTAMPMWVASGVPGPFTCAP